MEDQFSSNIYYLVRHGEAENNVLNVLNASIKGQYGLTERGQRQIEALGEWLADRPLDFIVASPILRTKESALLLAEKLSLPLSLDARLCEPRFGQFEGGDIQTFLDFMQTHGGRTAGDPALGIDGYMDIRARVRAFLTDLNHTFQGKQVVIVSHMDVLQELYAELAGEPVGGEQGEGHWHPRQGSVCIMYPDQKPEFFEPH
jgi:probable phosphoglycerate mutase